jgi:hypothetical protein
MKLPLKTFKSTFKNGAGGEMLISRERPVFVLVSSILTLGTLLASGWAECLTSWQKPSVGRNS